MTTAAYATQRPEPEIDRRDTGVRILLTILLAIVTELLGSIVGLIVVFGLLWSLITRRAPSVAVRNAANRLIAYDYRIARWLTYNEREIPFPFSDFPEPLEASTWEPDVRESEELGFDLDEDEKADGDGDGFVSE
ncbi:MAG TPA: DUF4389 domain-containing protein [Myxococcota bacterium]|nr:DUF4389 domain-containing protein [Myxococcota bacterium]